EPGRMQVNNARRASRPQQGVGVDAPLAAEAHLLAARDTGRERAGKSRRVEIHDAGRAACPKERVTVAVPGLLPVANAVGVRLDESCRVQVNRACCAAAPQKSVIQSRGLAAPADLLSEIRPTRLRLPEAVRGQVDEARSSSLPEHGMGSE